MGRLLLLSSLCLLAATALPLPGALAFGPPPDPAQWEALAKDDPDAQKLLEQYHQALEEIQAQQAREEEQKRYQNQGDGQGNGQTGGQDKSLDKNTQYGDIIIHN